MCHSVLHDLPLLDAERQPNYKYGFYVRLLTQTAWRVPVLHGYLPRFPLPDATPYQKGSYALLLLLLFGDVALHLSSDRLVDGQRASSMRARRVAFRIAGGVAVGGMHRRFVVDRLPGRAIINES